MIKVRAIQRGFVGSLRDPGDEFDVEDHAFSERWMERVEPVKRGKRSAPQPDEPATMDD